MAYSVESLPALEGFGNVVVGIAEGDGAAVEARGGVFGFGEDFDEPADRGGFAGLVDFLCYQSSFKANWTCLDVVEVLVIAPAVPERPVGVKTIKLGVLKFARFSRLKSSRSKLEREPLANGCVLERGEVPRREPGAIQCISAEVSDRIRCSPGVAGTRQD